MTSLHPFQHCVKPFFRSGLWQPGIVIPLTHQLVLLIFCPPSGYAFFTHIQLNDFSGILARFDSKWNAKLSRSATGFSTESRLLAPSPAHGLSRLLFLTLLGLLLSCPVPFNYINDIFSTHMIYLVICLLWIVHVRSAVKCVSGWSNLNFLSRSVLMTADSRCAIRGVRNNQ